MSYFLLGVLVIVLATTVAARISVTRGAFKPVGTQVAWAALACPAICLALFAIATIVTLVNGRHVTEPGGTTGMVVFSLVFFLIYGLALSAVVGVPTAMLTVRLFRWRSKR